MECSEMRKLYKESMKITEDNTKKAADQIYDYVMKELTYDFGRGNYYGESEINVINLIKQVTDFSLDSVYWTRVCTILVEKFRSEHYLATAYTEGGTGKVVISGWADDSRWMEGWK